MPNPHFRVNHITRERGQNAIASAAYRAADALEEHRPDHSYGAALNAAAYRSGEQLADAERGKVFSFVHKSGVLHTEIFTPSNAPEWAKDRERLWNEVEHAENTSTRWQTARLARDFVASLPRELSHEEHRNMVEAFVRENFTRKGLVADVAYHEVKARDGGKNPHVHIMVTTREISEVGFSTRKARWMDKVNTLHGWRDSWEAHTNEALALAGREERLSLKSYKAQGIDRLPREWLTREEWVKEQRGERTPTGDTNRRIEAENRLRDERRRLAQAEDDGNGRVPLWSDFGWHLGAATDAARDTVHRFRQKDADDARRKGNAVSGKEPEPSGKRDIAAAFASLSQGDQQAIRDTGVMLNNANQSETRATPGPQRDAATVFASLSESNRQAVRDIGAKMNTWNPQDVRESELGQLSPSTTPQVSHYEVERSHGRTQSGNNTPRSPYVTPGRPSPQGAAGTQAWSVEQQESAAVTGSLGQGSAAPVEQRLANEEQQPQRAATKQTQANQQAVDDLSANIIAQYANSLAEFAQQQTRELRP